MFVDRDGTIVELVDYLCDPQQVRLCPGAREGLRALRAAGYRLVVATNQSGLARGLFNEEQRQAVDREIERHLGSAAAPDSILFCPHHPQGSRPELTRSCPCRKPRTGLLREAARREGLDLSRSYLVGDSPADVECGRRAGLRTVQVGTGYGGAVADPHEYGFPLRAPTHKAADFGAAAAWILNDAAQRRVQR